jgi:ABC-type antimicrobial peptide transport system permease subunit
MIDEDTKGITRTLYQVVGVSKDTRNNGLTGKGFPLLYMPMTQPHGDNLGRVTFLIRTAQGNTPVLSAARQILRREDAALPIDYARSMDDQMAPFTAVHRAMAQIAVAFGAVALMLAAIGLYGVLSFSVARRRSEMAIRIALGARPGRVVAMVMRETGMVVAGGLLLGAGLTYEALRWIQSELYGVTAEDPVTLGLAVGLLVLVAMIAIYMPARRASRLDPIVALRQE